MEEEPQLSASLGDADSAGGVAVKPRVVGRA